MTPLHFGSLLLAAGPEETTLRFKSLPPLWVLIMLIVPAVVAVTWWVYRREGATASRRARVVLGTLRALTILLVILILFQPYAETSVRRLVKSHLVVLIDTSASMEFVDNYADPIRAQEVRDAANLGLEPLADRTRLDLVKGVLGNPDLKLLDRLEERFHLHLYTFDADTALVSSVGDRDDEELPLPMRIAELRATGAFTFLGNAVSEVLDEFRLRDEPLAGVVVFSDGRQNGGDVSPVEAARKAGSARPRVPVFMVGVGELDQPRNVHVANLRAKEVVLRGDDVSFKFTVTNKGYEGEPVTVELLSVDPETGATEELDLTGADVVLGPEDREQTVTVSHRFRRPGSYALRIGVPVVSGEKIENDNYVVHHLRVVDKRIKVLYVDRLPRWEYRFLKNALVRDTETVMAHVILQSADKGVVQPYSDIAGWRPRQSFPLTKEELYEYDVIIFGDVSWQDLADGDETRAREALENVKSFVEDGGGFMMIAGPYESPRSYRSTPIRDVLPVVLDLDEEHRVSQDTATSFNLKLTEEGREHPIMQLSDDPEESRRIWEDDRFSAQFWYYPVKRKKSIAQALAVHPGEYNRNAYGQHVIMAVMKYGKGWSLFVGVDELWRLRWSFGDRFHYRFYGEAIRFLATYKLHGGNKRFKIFTDRDRYFVGDRVTISADVFDRDFKPSTAEFQTVTIRTPEGEERAVELKLVPKEPGTYRNSVTVNQEGTYRITAKTLFRDEERPEKLFKVEYSTEEMKNPLIDLETMEGMARESGGQFLTLAHAGELPDGIPPKSVYVSSEVRSEDLWDDTWVLLLFTALLAAEWLIRKRYRLL